MRGLGDFWMMKWSLYKKLRMRKKYIIDGYAINQKRIKQLRVEKLTELDSTIKLLQHTIQKRQLTFFTAD